jgi:cysteine sulfinate desulfinase/cysteine desulfurase-like protein
MEAYEGLLGEKTKMVAVTHMSNVLGTINDVAEIVRLAHAAGAQVLLDGCQAIVHSKVDVKAWTSISTSSPATSSTARPASACCTARPSAWPPCRLTRAAAR